MAEQGWTNNKIAKETIKEYMKPFKESKIDKLILGCTHYPLFKNLIQEELGNNVEIINTGEKMANYLSEYLINGELENNKNSQGNCEYYLTDTECNFVQVADNLMQAEQIKDKIKKVDME